MPDVSFFHQYISTKRNLFNDAIIYALQFTKDRLLSFFPNTFTLVKRLYLRRLVCAYFSEKFKYDCFTVRFANYTITLIQFKQAQAIKSAATVTEDGGWGSAEM